MPVRLASLLPTNDYYNWDVLNVLSNGMIDCYNQLEMIDMTGVPAILSTIALGHLLLIPAQIKLRQSYFKYSNERINLEYLALRAKIGQLEKRDDAAKLKAECDAFRVSGPIDYKYLIPSGLLFSLHSLALVNLAGSVDILNFSSYIDNVLEFNPIIYLIGFGKF